MEDLVDEVSARRSRRQRDESLALEIARLQNFLFREAVTCRQHRDARRRRQPLARQAGMRDRHLGKADVALVVQYPVDHDRRDHAEEGEVEVGPLFQEMSGEPRQIAVRQCRKGRDSQRAGAAAADFLGCRGDAFEPDEGALDFGIERHGRSGRHEAGAAPLEQLHFSSAWRSRSSRLTAGCVTVISAAASVTLPVSIVARKASTCRELIRAILIPFITFRHAEGAIIHWTMEVRVCDLFHQDWRQPAFSADWRGSNLQIAPKPAEQGPEPCPGRVCAEGNAEGASAREIRRHVTSFRYWRSDHMKTLRLLTAVSIAALVAGPFGRLGPAEDALCGRLRRLVRADHPRGGVPGLREEARRQGRVRRRQLDRYAGQAAGAEGQPGRSTSPSSTTARCTRRSSSASARKIEGLANERALSTPRCSRTTRRSRSAMAGTGFMIQHQGVQGEGLGRRRPRGTTSRIPKFKKQLVIPPINNTYGLYTLMMYRAHERRRREEHRSRLQGDEGRRSIPTCWSMSRRRAR